MKLMSCSILVTAAFAAAFSSAPRPRSRGPGDARGNGRGLQQPRDVHPGGEADGARPRDGACSRAPIATPRQRRPRPSPRSSAGQPAKEDVEAVAALVSQLGYEGDNSVAAIRKRLLDGGHHHNAAGEAQGIYDEGFVIVTKEMKKSFLDSAVAIGKMTGSPTAAGLTAEWDKVKATWGRVAKGGK